MAVGGKVKFALIVANCSDLKLFKINLPGEVKSKIKRYPSADLRAAPQNPESSNIEVALGIWASFGISTT